jgi:hypothetical protein
MEVSHEMFRFFLPWKHLGVLIFNVIYVENQAFSPSYVLAPAPPPLSPSPVSKLSLFSQSPISLCITSRANWQERVGGRGGVGEEPNDTAARKPGPLHVLYSLQLTLCIWRSSRNRFMEQESVSNNTLLSVVGNWLSPYIPTVSLSALLVCLLSVWLLGGDRAKFVWSSLFIFVDSWNWLNTTFEGMLEQQNLYEKEKNRNEFSVVKKQW